MVDVIHVDLYGGKSIFGGREEPLVASVISCSKYKDCSYYQNGECLAVDSFLSRGCKFGSEQRVKGYTSRAKKYHSFKKQWEEHEAYGKLKHPPKKLGLIDDVVVFPYPYVRIIKNEEGNWEIKNPSFISEYSYIDYEDFDVDLIYQICTFRPHAIMGGVIDDYQKETVPLFLSHLQKVLPERYSELIEKYPQLDKPINYVGRKALLKTIKPSEVLYKSSSNSKFNERWYWDGEYLIYREGYVSSFSITKDYEVCEIKLKPSDQSVITITDNDQVTDETVFVD